MAFTHASAREPLAECNERLEFLGDSILGFIVSEYLYGRFPEKSEGQLSFLKSVIVSSKMLAITARELSLESLVIRGKSITSMPESILSNVYESIVAAIYLDRDIGAARHFVTAFHISRRLPEILGEKYEKNYKSILQDYAQKQGKGLPKYRLVCKQGPDHNSKFAIEVTVGGKAYGPSWGPTKKEAEQQAAKLVLKEIGVL
jgi:ribonuclease-3